MTGRTQRRRSPPTAETIIASFGSAGIFGLTMEGDVFWETDLGDMNIRGEFGEGSSPILYRGLVLILWDPRRGVVPRRARRVERR